MTLRYKDLLHILRIQGPMTEDELCEELPGWRNNMDAALAALDEDNLAHKLKRRTDTGRIEEVWVANPRGSRQAYQRQVQHYVQEAI